MKRLSVPKKNQVKYAVSSCLLGQNCKYNGGNNYNEELVEFLKDKEYIGVCPEVLGGLDTPRIPCEIQENKVVDQEGNDRTKSFLLGANLALNQIKEKNVSMVIVQSRSPSCGKGMIYDGSFTQHKKPGNGVFVNVLLKENILVYDIKEFLKIIK